MNYDSLLPSASFNIFEQLGHFLSREIKAE